MPSYAPTREALAQMEPEDAKAAIRAYVRERRAQRSERGRAAAAEAFASHVLDMPEMRAAACVSVYASRPTEPGTLTLIRELDERGVRVLVPLLGEGLQRGWAVYTADGPLAPRAPGRPPEPQGDFLPSAAVAEASVLVVPALGVDMTGTRLGQGGGWYDRTLPDAHPDALVVALVFPEELHGHDDPLPREAHDMPVHAAITPEGRVAVGGAA